MIIIFSLILLTSCGLNQTNFSEEKPFVVYKILERPNHCRYYPYYVTVVNSVYYRDTCGKYKVGDTINVEGRVVLPDSLQKIR